MRYLLASLVAASLMGGVASTHAKPVSENPAAAGTTAKASTPTIHRIRDSDGNRMAVIIGTDDSCDNHFWGCALCADCPGY